MNRPLLDALNYGRLITLGPEIGVLHPQQYSFNAEYRLWIRALPHGKPYAHDHCLIISPGYSLLNNKSMLRFRAGDLLRLPIGATLIIVLG